jgi:hypothetical protein
MGCREPDNPFTQLPQNLVAGHRLTGFWNHTIRGRSPRHSLPKLRVKFLADATHGHSIWISPRRRENPLDRL